MTTVSLIAAVARNGVIGADGAMPWHLPEDLAHFKRTTMGRTVVMGRRTWDSIGRPLPGRRTIVVTRQLGWLQPGVETAHSLVQALSLAGPEGEVFVAGGGQIYGEAMPWAQRMLITEVDQLPTGDVRFPRIDMEQWDETGRDVHEGYAFVTYTRRGRAS